MQLNSIRIGAHWNDWQVWQRRGKQEGKPTSDTPPHLFLSRSMIARKDKNRVLNKDGERQEKKKRGSPATYRQQQCQLLPAKSKGVKESPEFSASSHPFNSLFFLIPTPPHHRRCPREILSFPSLLLIQLRVTTSWTKRQKIKTREVEERATYLYVYS